MDKFTCDECGAVYKSKTELDAHMERDHAIQPAEPATREPTTRS